MRRVVVWMVVVMSGFLGGSTEGWAGDVQYWIRALKGNRSVRIRVRAVKELRRHTSPQAIQALREAVRSRREHVYVRSAAALGLARMRATQAIPDLQRATRAHSRLLRRRAWRALRSLCPRSVLRRKRFYLHLAPIQASGIQSRFAKALLAQNVRSMLRQRRDATTVWYRCRKPKRWMLRRRRMSGYQLRLRLKMSYTGGKIRSRLTVLITTYPGDAIKASTHATASAATTPHRAIIRRLIRAVTGSLRSDLRRFLNRR